MLIPVTEGWHILRLTTGRGAMITSGQHKKTAQTDVSVHRLGEIYETTKKCKIPATDGSRTTSSLRW